eukprot:TRINITY_DN40552_c0_g1_i1.p1 TRINITY_DN40552_c0_g1~~TRINITY_DN40552_c0_g1_i1.p1  ORF type:complete len:473 (-),score=61.54 TRINITY_DN40552_c0_g1_i1:12-1430(-)
MMMSYSEFQGLPEESKNDPQMALDVARHGFQRGWASPALMADRNFVMQLVALGNELEFASDVLRDDEQIVTLAIGFDGGALAFASDRIQDNRTIVIAAINCNKAESVQHMQLSVDPFSFASARLRNDREVALIAVGRRGWSLQHMSDSLRDDPDVVRIAVEHGYCSWGRYEACSPLEFASHRLRDDDDIVALAVKHDPDALEHASERCRQDKSLVTYGFQRLLEVCGLCEVSAADRAHVRSKYRQRMLERRILHFVEHSVDPTLRTDPELVLSIVKRGGTALQFASPELRSNEEVCLAAIRNNAAAIKWADALVKHDVVNADLALEGAFQTNPGVQHVCTQFLPMYRSGMCADVKVILSDGAFIFAHKLVLCARSPVFKARFSSKMNDSQDELHLGSCSFDGADIFLEFLYSGLLDRSRVCAACQPEKQTRSKRLRNSLFGPRGHLFEELQHLADFYQVHDLSEVLLELISL